MLKNLKKFLFIVPCMILGIFLFSGSKAMAGDAKLMDSNYVTVGSSSKANTYYFSNSATWEFKASFSAIKEWDTFLKWRVVRPDGMATDWSDKDYYVDNEGKFTISNYRNLNYNQNLGLSGRSSIAPNATYYVDIEYYAQLLWSSHQEEKDETIKIIVAENSTLATPTIGITLNGSEFLINAGFSQSGYGVITSIEYFYAYQDMEINNYANFTSGKNQSSNSGSFSLTPAGSILRTLSVDNSATELYVAVTTGNGYTSVSSYRIATPPTQGGNEGNQGGSVNDNVNPPQGTTNSGDGTGLFDYDFGELILIVLVIVLIVSCALIITQKIVDYKKRLY